MNITIFSEFSPTKYFACPTIVSNGWNECRAATKKSITWAANFFQSGFSVQPGKKIAAIQTKSVCHLKAPQTGKKIVEKAIQTKPVSRSTTVATGQRNPANKPNIKKPFSISSTLSSGIEKCVSIVPKKPSHVTKLGLGAAAGLAGSSVFLTADQILPSPTKAEAFNSICVTFNSVLSQFPKDKFRLDCDEYVKSECAYSGLIDQVNKYNEYRLNKYNEIHKTNIIPCALDASYYKFFSIIGSNASLPVLNGLIFRGVLQDLVLKRLPQFVLKKTMPDKATLMDTKIAKISRVVIAAAAETVLYSPILSSFSRSQVIASNAMRFAASIFLGSIKESRLGLLGSIGADYGLNAVPALLNAIYDC